MFPSCAGVLDQANNQEDVEMADADLQQNTAKSANGANYFSGYCDLRFKRDNMAIKPLFHLEDNTSTFLDHFC